MTMNTSKFQHFSTMALETKYHDYENLKILHFSTIALKPNINSTKKQ